jgi:Rrf2 family protein
MKLSAKTEYACLAMLALAQDYAADRPSQIRRIAADQSIPDRFLVQILLDLKRSGLVTSTRGAAGGYRLARDPREISLADVVESVEGDERLSSSLGRPTPMSMALLEACEAASEAERNFLQTVTLADLLEQAAHGREAMWYI